MSSSGLIYAVIVGAWAAYLVPMWLRRQDELNEARPTERFSTAIRLLAGRSAMERRASRALGDDTRDDDSTSTPASAPEPGPTSASSPPSTSTSMSTSAVELPAQGEAAAEPAPDLAPAAPVAAEREPVRREPVRRDSAQREAAQREAAQRDEPRRSAERRARLLARRRRMVTTLFMAFAVGAVVAAVAGVAFLWVPALPAALLTLYIGHLRRLERQRYEVKLDRARAAQAAERLRDRERARSREQEERQEPGRRRTHHDAAHPADPGRPHLRLAADPAEHAEGGEQGAPPETRASALVEATDHEEWVDGMRERSAAGPDSWEPVPVPLPTYVTAPVAPRVSRGLDLGARGTWDSGRPAESRNTPLFDQYADAAPPPPEDDYVTRPRAANE